eukprot:14370361-Ditylum_brightwellii.AAC.1
MGNDIRSEMTKVIDNLTTSAITKIDNYMSTQFGAMSTTVSTINTQMIQASVNMMKVFNNATQQQQKTSNPRHIQPFHHGCSRHSRSNTRTFHTTTQS